jgi:hypothetical protein
MRLGFRESVDRGAGIYSGRQPWRRLQRSLCWAGRAERPFDACGIQTVVEPFAAGRVNEAMVHGW